jgi:hypothetical protein
MGLHLDENGQCAVCDAVKQGATTFDHSGAVYPVCQRHLNMAFDQMPTSLGEL